MRDTAQGLAFLRTLLALFRERTELDPRLVVAHSRPVRGELAFDRVSFSYSGRPALQDVSFLVPAGRVAAVVGPTGSGKSSLVRLVCRLFEPDAGRILLDGVPISEMPLSAVRQSIAVVPQDTVLFHDTIGRNIGFGRFGADASEIQAAARVANLHELIMELPDRYDTVVGERGLQLSGGERQRVAIARAVLKRPRIFVFDEATSSLDPTTERDILRNLADVASHTTTLIIAHRLATIQHADEILVLDRGRIVERGTHPQLLARHGTFSKLWLDQEGRANSAAGSALSINRRQTSSSPMR